MSITASLTHSGNAPADPDDLLAAFANNELRGVASPSTVGGQDIFFLTVYANTSGDSLQFAYYDAVNNRVAEIQEGTLFTADAVVGSVADPVSFSTMCGLATSSEVLPEIANGLTLLPAYPNPFAERTTLSYKLAFSGDVSVRVVDMLGREVKRLEMGYLPAGQHEVLLQIDALPAGTYLYQVITQTHRQQALFTKNK